MTGRRTLTAFLAAAIVTAAGLAWPWPVDLAPIGAIRGAHASTIRISYPPSGVPAWCQGALACWAPASAASEPAALVDLTGGGRDLVRSGSTSWTSGAGIRTTITGHIITSVVPGLDSTIAVRVTDCAVPTGSVLYGARTSSPNRWTAVYADTSGRLAAAWGTALPTSVAATPGLVAVGPGWLVLGSSVAQTWTPAGTAPTHAIAFSGQNTDGTVIARVACTWRAMAIWVPAITSAEAIARLEAMP